MSIRTGLVALIALLAAATGTSAGPAQKGGRVPDPVAVKPFLDVPMQSPAICRGPDGMYYLTGTVSADPKGGDFANNDGVWLWRSKDLAAWEPLGQVWSIERDAPRSPASAWQLKKRAARDSGRPGRGMVSPEIHFIKGTFYIPYSMNGWGCGLLKSTTGKAEGPYADVGLLAPQGQSMSLFADDDGAVYMVLDEGWIARMKDDLSGLREPPRLMRPRPGSDLGNAPFTVGRRGAFLCKRQGVYYLVSSEWTSRTGWPVHDTYVASARSVYGPYDCRHLMVAHGGETTVLEAADGRWYATMSGDDTRAKFRNRPALVPLVFGKEDLYFGRGVSDEFPCKPMHVITERGPWEVCRPLTDHAIRDVEVMVHRDGFVYYTGSSVDDRFPDQVVLWRFKVDDAAKVGRGETAAECKVVMSFKDLHWLDNENRLKFGKNRQGSYGLTRCCMDADVFYLKGTFYMTFNLYSLGELAQKRTLDDGKTFTAGSGLIRSRSGTWEGPWESVGRVPYAHCSLREDSEGRIVTHRGWRGVQMLRPDGTFEVLKAPGELPRIQYPAEGTAFCDDGSAFAHVDYNDLFGAWQWLSTEWNGAASLDIEQRPGSTYNATFSWSESGKEEGPYPRCSSTLPHCGGAAMFRDSKGRYWSTFFGNDSTSPWFERMGIIPLKVEKRGMQYVVDVADEWPTD